MLSGRKHGLLVLSALVYAINVVDRQLLPLMAESVRRDIALADWQLGLLTGVTFALCYAVFTLPLAWIADNGNRRNLVAGCLGLFSIATGICGFVQNFWQFAVARTAVALGEAGTTPATLSMLSDAFPNRRGFASGVLTAGAHLGILAGAIFAAVLAQRWGWRSSFIVSGIVGTLISLLYLALVREPKRLVGETESPRPSYGASIAGLLCDARFRWLTVATGGLLFFTNATGAWTPTFLIRAHALTLPQVGAFVGLTAGLLGMICVLAAGPLLDRLMRRDARWAAWLPALTFVVMIVTTALGVMVESTPITLILLAIGPCVSLVVQTGMFTILQATMPRGLQASATAMLFLIANLFGMGLGPTFVGTLSSLWEASSALSLRPALLVGIGPTLIGLFACFKLAQLVRRDAAAALAPGAIQQS